MRLTPERALLSTLLGSVLIGVLLIIITRGSLKISQPFPQTVSENKFVEGRGVLSENRISIVLVGVVNWQELS